jgi:hypothetical protein
VALNWNAANNTSTFTFAYPSSFSTASFSRAGSLESLDESQIKAVKRLLALKDCTDEERQGLAESLAQHSDVSVDMAKALLGLVKVLLEVGELQEKIAR